MTDQADPTGMGHQKAREIGRVRAIGRGIISRVPFTQAKKDRLNREAADKAGAEEKARLEAQASAKDQAEGRKVGASPDIKTVQGDYIVKLKNELIDALRTGQSRTHTLAPDMMIRQVVCHDKFIDAIENRMIRTPIEEVNTEYARDMVGKRKRLADQLRMAKANSEYTIAKLTTHDLDVIITTMLGNTDIWKKEDWPQELPRPHDAFFRFLESVAMRKSKDNEGHYIGHVLKALATMRTFTGATMKATNKELVDVANINDYLHRRSAESIDMVVAEFQHRLSLTLQAPTDQMELETGVPGLGLVQRFQEAVRVRDAVGELARTYQEAHKEYEEAKAAYDQVAPLKKKADAKKSTLAADQYQKIEEAYTTAKQRFTKATGEVKEAKEAYEEAAPEALKYRDVEHPARVVQKLVDDFRSLVLEMREGETPNAERISESIAGALHNTVVIDLLNSARTLLTENRESKRLANSRFGEYLERVEAIIDDKDALIQMKQRFVDKFAEEQTKQEHERIKGNIQKLEGDIKGSSLPDDVKTTLGVLMENLANMGYDNTKLQAKLNAIYLQENLLEVDRMISDSPLPIETKAEAKKVFAAVKRKGSTEGLSEQIEAVKKVHAYPLRKIALLSAQSLEKPSVNNPVALDPKQRIVARMIWEKESEEEDPPIKERGRWERLKNWFSRRFSLFSDEGFHRIILGGIANSFKKDLVDIANFRGYTHDYRLDNQLPLPSKYWRRGMRGITNLAIKGYLIATIVVGYQSPSYWTHYTAQDRWYRPWTWVTPLRVPRPTIRRIHDNYDVPERLAGRGDAFYRQYYGVGTRRLQSESSDAGKSARLEWLRNNPDVLRFFQERILTTDRQVPMRVDTWRQLGETPETCGQVTRPAQPVSGGVAPTATGPAPARQIPRSCEALNLRTVEAVTNYTPHDDDAWSGAEPVCCTIEIRRSPIADGLLLNSTASDRFVDMLMAQQRGQTQVTYAYLNSTENRLRWVNEGFLVGPSEYDIIRNYRIENRDNIQFLLVQGTRVTGRLNNLFERAHSPNFVDTANHDRFVASWIAQARTLQGGPVNPSVDLLTDDIVTRGFDAAIAAGKTAQPPLVLDVTAEHERWNALREVEPLRLQTDTAKDVAAAQQDIRQLLVQFLPSSAPFAINLERSDEFVMVLDNHKRRGGAVTDFSPFTNPQGSRVQWAISMGYMRAREDFRPEGAQSRDGDTQTQTAVVAPPQPQQDLGPEADRFFRNPNAETLSQFLDGVIAGLHTARGGDADAMNRVMGSRYGGSQENMDRAIRTEVYRFLNSTNPADMQQRATYGLSTSGSGEQMQVQITNMGRARTSLRNHIMQFVRRQM